MEKKIRETIEKQLNEIKKRMQHIKHKIVVLSCKGGVGKSFITANLALALAKKGYKIAVLDSDFHGPAIPKMLGIANEKLIGGPLGIMPVTARNDIQVVSIDFLLPSEEVPVIWRGPLKANALRQLLSQVYWGERDFLLIDLPPGTGDEVLNVVQMIPNITGAIIVTIPSEVSQRVVKKAISFANEVKVKVLGLIENMAYIRCPYCKNIVYLWGKDGEKLAKEMNVPFLGKLPIDPKASELMDKGMSFIDEMPESEITKAFLSIVDKLLLELSRITSEK